MSRAPLTFGAPTHGLARLAILKLHQVTSVPWCRDRQADRKATSFSSCCSQSTQLALNIHLSYGSLRHRCSMQARLTDYIHSAERLAVAQRPAPPDHTPHDGLDTQGICKEHPRAERLRPNSCHSASRSIILHTKRVQTSFTGMTGVTSLQYHYSASRCTEPDFRKPSMLQYPGHHICAIRICRSTYSNQAGL